MIEKIVIVGGGSAGWLTASILASRFKSRSSSIGKQSADIDGVTNPRVVLIESPDVATVGVGEGTWPSMRATLQEIGVSETNFMRECDVSLKQGTRFNNWMTGGEEHYYHPFSLPNSFHQLNLADYWPHISGTDSFANAVSPQATLCDMGLSAKQISTPEYAFAVNYGYHLNAGKFADFLHRHCTEHLGVEYITDHVDDVNSGENGDIQSLLLRERGDLPADLFIDCSGFSALLIGKHFEIEQHSLADVLFNDRAIAVQVPYTETQAIQSTTHSTAQSAGWIWDIGLSSRRGVGHVYSSRHQSDEFAEDELMRYLRQSMAGSPSAERDPIIDDVKLKKLSFEPAYCKQPWVNNCIAIGLSAGFVEPLEASALVLIETAAKALAKDLPQSPEHAMILRQRFNKKMLRHWSQIIDFLKLHYVLSQRSDSEYWQAHRSPESIPKSLKDALVMWRYRAPWVEDTPMIDELFSAASFQYVLFGMGFNHEPNEQALSALKKEHAKRCFAENRQKIEKLVAALPDNRTLHSRVMQYGFQRV